MQTTIAIPIVFHSVGSPVERKIVGSLARPGGNVTGLSNDVGPVLSGKQPELFSLHAAHRARIINFTSRSRLPAMYNIQVFVRDGGLMAFAPGSHALAERAAVCVDKILRGAWPGDLAVERPTKFELTINLKTARTLGLTIPQSVLQRADQVIR